MSPRIEKKHYISLLNLCTRLNGKGLPTKKLGTEWSAPVSGSQRRKTAIGRSDFHARFKDGITKLSCKAKETVFSQGSPSDHVFFIQKGRIKLTIVSARGKEIIGVLGSNEFFGEQCLTGQRFRGMTVTALEDCSLLRIERGEMLLSLREDSGLSSPSLYLFVIAESAAS